MTTRTPAPLSVYWSVLLQASQPACSSRNALVDQRDPDYSEELIEERIALGAVPRVKGRVVEFDRDDWSQRSQIAEDEVHLLCGHTVEGRMVHLAVRDLAEIAHADLQQDEEAIADRVLQDVVEVELGWR